MNSEIYIKGIVTVHFDIAIDRVKFSNVCTKLGLNSEKIDEFTESNWLAVRGQLSDEVYARPGDMEIVHVCEQTALVDQINFLDDEHYEVTFNTLGDAVQCIEKDGESLTVKL
jgi:hypothetical protein